MQSFFSLLKLSRGENKTYSIDITSACEFNLTGSFRVSTKQKNHHQLMSISSESIVEKEALKEISHQEEEINSQISHTTIRTETDTSHQKGTRTIKDHHQERDTNHQG